MGWAVLACFLLIAVFLANFERRRRQGRLEDAGLNLFGAVVVTIAGVILIQFV